MKLRFTIEIESSLAIDPRTHALVIEGLITKALQGFTWAGPVTVKPGRERKPRAKS